MNLHQALKWADENAKGEVVDRLRSRKVASVLANTVRTYAAWIRQEGMNSDTCTFHILGEVCEYCECKRITELEGVIVSHGIPVKTYTGGVAHYCTGEIKIP